MSGFRAFYFKGDSKESNGDISSVVFKNGLSYMCKNKETIKEPLQANNHNNLVWRQLTKDMKT